MSIMTKFSNELYNYRKTNQLSQKEMSERCDLSIRHYQDLEMGRVNPALSTAVRISAILDISLDSLKSEVPEHEVPFSRV